MLSCCKAAVNIVVVRSDLSLVVNGNTVSREYYRDHRCLFFRLRCVARRVTVQVDQYH
ncbi:MAG: hypothetical protein ACJA2B_001921, partial [Candidatus Endobugula sp.]